MKLLLELQGFGASERTMVGAERWRKELVEWGPIDSKHANDQRSDFMDIVFKLNWLH